MTDPLARPYWRGRTNVDAMTIAAIEAAEERAGFTFTITQGSYQSTVEASAGTHDRGGVIDFHTSSLSADNKARMIAALRAVGWAAWVRYPWQGPWPEHAHGVVIGHPYLASSAANQVTEYRNGRDGLAANRADYHPRPNPIPSFKFPPEDDMQEADFDRIANIVDRAIEARTDEIASAVTQRILGADLFPKREDIARTVREALTTASNEASRKGARDGKA